RQTWANDFFDMLRPGRFIQEEFGDGFHLHDRIQEDSPDLLAYRRGGAASRLPGHDDLVALVLEPVGKKVPLRRFPDAVGPFQSDENAFLSHEGMVSKPS